MQRALTGVQPSGHIHLGNYLGSIVPALELQRSYRAFYFIADYHALTSIRDPAALRESSRQVAATFIALGLDTDTHCLFRQSDVIEVCELAWILACQINTGMLDRGHAVKAARDGGREPNAGTLFYPVLMSADILLYDANVVPVGRDQQQHVEIARDIAQRVNHHYGEGTLVVPEVSVRDEVGTVLGLDGRKMSKSYGNAIHLWDPPKKLRKTIMKIVTSSKEMGEPLEVEGDNVLNLYKLFATPAQLADIEGRYRAGAVGYGHAKQELFELVDGQVAEARARYDALMANPAEIDGILEAGADKARASARATMERVRAAVGIR
ncbi:MAG: tryptophan--tRNA ligase [Alphaproteobacteria bacterium]|nr:tryptophan--tRNA ligase [Alphaproteobacteria bacterium]